MSKSMAWDNQRADVTRTIPRIQLGNALQVEDSIGHAPLVGGGLGGHVCVAWRPSLEEGCSHEFEGRGEGGGGDTEAAETSRANRGRTTTRPVPAWRRGCYAWVWVGERGWCVCCV